MAIKKTYSDLYVDGEVTGKKLIVDGEYSLPTVDGSAGQLMSTDGLGNVSFVNISTLGFLDPSSIVNGTGLTWTQISPGILQGDVDLSPFSTTDLVEGTRLYFTNERVDDRVNALLLAGTGVTKSYNDGANSLTLGVTLSPFSTTDLVEGTRLYFTNERVDDRVAALIQNSASITWVYDDSLNTLTASAVSSPLQIEKDGTLVASRGKIDFITGSNTTLTVLDDVINNKVTVQIDASVGALDDLSDVVALSPSPGEILAYNGSNWLNVADTAVIQLGAGLNSSLRVNNLNAASGDFSTVSGGYVNTASSYYTTIGGGTGNTASGYQSTVAGGNSNIASGNESTVGGGYINSATGDWSTVAGGNTNTASGTYSAVLGGVGNTVTHDNSGAFGTNITSAANNTFHVNNLNIVDLPNSDTTNTATLVRNSSTGQVGLRYHGGMFAQTSDGSAISATVTETTLISSGVGTLTVPANGFAVGDSFSVSIGGIISSANGETVTIRVKTGSVVLCSSGAVSLPALSSRNWKLQVDFTVRSIGAATVAAIISNGQFSFSNASFDVLGADLGSLENTSFNTTASNTLDITAQWGSTNATNSIKSTMFVLYKNY